MLLFVVISSKLLLFVNFKIMLSHCLIIYVVSVSSNCAELTIPYIVSSLFLISPLVFVFKSYFIIAFLYHYQQLIFVLVIKSDFHLAANYPCLCFITCMNMSANIKINNVIHTWAFICMYTYFAFITAQHTFITWF